MKEGLSNYWPGYSDDGTADWLSDYRGKTSKIQNKELKGDIKKFEKPSSKSMRDIIGTTEEESILWNKWQWSNMVMTSLQDGFYIDTELFDKALENYKEVIAYDWSDGHMKDSYPYFKDSIELIISKMEEEKKDGPLGDGRGYYSPSFMDWRDEERIKIDNKHDEGDSHQSRVDSIKKALSEVYFLGHSTDRIKERLSVFSDIDFPIGVKREVMKNLSILDGYDFPKDKSYGVMLGNFKPNPKSEHYVEVAKGRGYYSLQDDKIIHDSTGDQFWVVIRNNEATTFMLRKAIQTNDDAHNREKLRVDAVIKNLDNFMNQKQQSSAPNMNKFKKLDLTNGKKVRYYFNANKFETLEGQPIKVDDIFDNLSPEMQEKVFAQMEG